MIEVNFSGEMSSNWPKDLLGINIYIELLILVDNRYWQYYNRLILLR